MIKVIWPEYIELKNWAAALIIDFSDENLPILDDEEKWQEWGTVIAGTGIFAKGGVPSPVSIREGRKSVSFDKWDEWAKIVYNIMANDPGDKNV